MGKKIANTKEMSREDWLELRRHSIGGSDAGAVLGMNQWASPITVYLDKTGMSKDKETTEAMRMGTDLEEYVAQRFCEKTGKKVRRDNFMYAHDDYDFITANIDREVVGENAGLECKTMSSFNGFDLENGEVPAHYYAQCQHYMAVKGYDKMYLAILVFQRGVFVLDVNRNDDFIWDLVSQEIVFWKEYVEKKTMPAPDGSDATEEALKELYPNASAGASIEDPKLDKYIREYRSLGDAIKRLEEQQKEAKEQIVLRLQDAEKGFGTEYSCTYKNGSRTSIDTQRLRMEMPEVYKKYSKTSTYRTFRTKKGA